MSAGRMANNVKPAGVTSKAIAILKDPNESATDLVDQDAKITLRLGNRKKINCDKVHASSEQHLSRKSTFSGRATSPASAVDKDHNRRPSVVRFIKMQSFLFFRSIRNTS